MRPLRWYFLLAFTISWTGVLFAASQHQLYLLFVAMLLGPSVSSIALTAYYEKARGLRELAHRLLRWRIGARWYATLLVAPLTLSLIALALSLYSSSFRPGFAIPFALIAGFGAGIFEELGWTGFATPRLLRRYSWFDAGLLLGLPWAVWHLLTDYVGRDVHGWLWIPHALQWVIALCAFRIFMTWVYSNTRSLLLGMLLHVSFTGSQALLWPVNPTLAVENIWYGLFAIAIWIPVVALIAKSRAMFDSGYVDDRGLRARM
ncbi:MAG TPA: CPBP family intramembrane glutamic endopeptidase [Kofleriaceae bacterium]